MLHPGWLLLGLSLIGASLAWQGWQLHGLLRPVGAALAPSAPVARLATPPSAQTLALFGQPASAPLRTASLDLRLQVGALIQPGVRLLSIQARQVELDVHGQRQRLGLHRTLSTAGNP